MVAGARQRWVLFGAIILASAIKLYLISLGPEPDPDAYAHAMAGRHVVAGQPGVAMHWVWLPLWHWVHAAAYWVGGIDSVRLLALLCTSLAPWLLADALESASTERTRLPSLAGALLALSPACLSAGSTSQLEAPTISLILGACAITERARAAKRISVASAAGVGALLASACLIRYEAWALPAVWLALTMKSPQRAVWSISWLLPASAIVGWCIHHRIESGEWLQFLRYNADFAAAYLRGNGFPWGPEPNAIFALGWYSLRIPLAEYTLLAPALFVGVARALRMGPRSLTFASAAIFAFLTVGLVRGQHLGLQRHALLLGPVYAVCAAAGLLALGDLLGRALRARRPSFDWQRAAALCGLALFIAGRVAPSLVTETAWRKRAYATSLALAAPLRTQFAPGDHVFSDESSVEVLTNLPPRAFSRGSLSSVGEADVQARASCNSSWIVSQRDYVTHLLPIAEEVTSAGELVLLRLQTTCPATQ